MMKKILFISAFPPSNKTAGQNYTVQLLNDISKDNTIDLYYWNYPGHEPLIPPTVNIIGTKTINKFQKIINAITAFFFFPLFTVRFNIGDCLKIRKLALLYDIIYFDFSQVFLYSLFIKHPCKVFMCHDIITQKFSRKRFASLFIWYVKLSERVILKTANLRMCFSEKDVNYTREILKLDSHKVSFYISNQVKEAARSENPIDNYFVLFGAWNRPENYKGLVWFTENVLPNCDIRCVIIGGGMNDEVKSKIMLSKVEYLGFVEDPYPIISRSACLLAPLFQGAGVKVKVIESLALGTPVIGTDIAFEGIDNFKYSGENDALILAQDAYDFIDKIRNFKTPSIVDKGEIRRYFLDNYQSNSFKVLLSNLPNITTRA